MVGGAIIRDMSALEANSESRPERPRRRTAKRGNEFSPSNVDCHATPPAGSCVHAIERTISRFIEGTNNAFAVRNAEAANVSVGSNSVIAVVSAARPLFHQKRKSICGLAMSQKRQERP